jgi:hypothetical protein
MKFVGMVVTVAFCCSLLGCNGGGTDENDAKVKSMLGNNPGGRIDMHNVGHQPRGAKEPMSHAQPGAAGAGTGGAAPTQPGP